MQTARLVLFFVLAPVVSALQAPLAGGETAGDGAAEFSTGTCAALESGPAGERQAVDRAVADAVHSFLEGYLAPQALAENAAELRARIEARPEAFVPEVKVLALDEENGRARAEVQARIAVDALRGALQDIAAPRTIVLAVTEETGRSDDAVTRLTAELRARTDNLRIVDPVQLETLSRYRSLRGMLGGQPDAAELGLRVLAELACVGTVRAKAEETHLKGVWTGIGEARVRVLSCATAEVVAAISLDFQDEIPARKTEAERRARDAIFRLTADALVKEIAAWKRADVRVSCDLGPIYAALLRGYPAQPFGRILVRNTGEEPAGPFVISVALGDSLLVEPFRAEVGVLPAGAERAVPVRGVLDAKLLDAAGGEVPARIALAEPGGAAVRNLTRAVLVHGRNAFSWREPRAIAAYVDPDDAAVKALLAAVWRALPEREIPTPALARAGAIYGALAALGLKYRPDAAVAARAAIDRVNFPGQTLCEGAGDCDDLAVLYAAALETAGIPSGIVVSADHVLVSVDTGLPPGLAGAVLGEDALVVRDGRAWLPVEATALTRGAAFSAAWDEARPARALLESGEAEFIAVREAWKTWPPPGRASGPASIATDGLSARIERETRALGDLVRARLEAAAAALAETAEGTRALGRLYAACGMIDAAREAFGRAIGEAEGFAARFNLGETLLLGRPEQRDPRAALAELERALALAPEGDGPARADTLLRIALAHRLLGEPEAEGRTLARARSIDAGAEHCYRALFAGPDKAGADGGRVRMFLLEGLK